MTHARASLGRIGWPLAVATLLIASVGAAVKLSEIDARVGQIMKDWDFA